MFKSHQTTIQLHARKNADNFARVCQFVILTVQNSLAQVEVDLETAEQGGDEAMGVLFGWKFEAYNSVWINREHLYSQCEYEARNCATERDLAFAIVDIFAAEVGFGLAKAGFIAQLIYGVAGCLDGHNIRRFGLSPRFFDNYKQLKTIKARGKKLNQYLDVCGNAGGCEVLWNGWCEYVAERQPKVYRDAHHVSLTHLTALGLKEHHEKT